MKIRNKILARTAIFCALLCLLGPIQLPFGPVPISFSLTGVFLTGLCLKPHAAGAAVMGYLLLGAIGLPVFSGFTSGIGVLMGPTGGFLLGYLFCAVSISRITNRKNSKTVLRVFACFIGLLLCYLCGVWGYCLYAAVTVAKAIAVCVVPFVGIDAAKIALAVLIDTNLRNKLRQYRRL